ncbi:hypothetical protein lerEdw1_018793 [Lerista edwardsae]|nr:hypothetical protein lerEdw1_018793 [Lerista edwardsae]
MSRAPPLPFNRLGKLVTRIHMKLAVELRALHIFEHQLMQLSSLHGGDFVYLVYRCRERRSQATICAIWAVSPAFRRPNESSPLFPLKHLWTLQRTDLIFSLIIYFLTIHA